MTWSLYEEGRALEPIRFSNGKTQEDIVNEVVDLIKKGERIIFIRGMCGTGKSAIALNIARELGKTSIVVPGKNLQRQYEKDYAEDKYLLKRDGKRLKINMITGRRNHECLFLKESKELIPKTETNMKLDDIFSERRKKINSMIERDASADNRNLPCKIEISEKNWHKIKDYLRQNRKSKRFSDVKEVKRADIAEACPYWCPIFPESSEGKSSEKKKIYNGLNNTKFSFYERKKGCKFYEQFNSYIDADVIVFNSLKYKLETMLNRKPETEAEIIDECDEFLDSFSNERNINIDRLQNSLAYIPLENEIISNIVGDVSKIIKEIRLDEEIKHITNSSEIIPLKETPLFELIKIFLSNKEFFYYIDEESYIMDVEETARMFEEFLEESYVSFDKRENNLYARIVTTNLAKKFKYFVDKNKSFVLMSGTVHSEEVLKEIFGLENFTIIDAETEQPGRIETVKTGMEFDCKYSNLISEENKRKYFLILEKCIQSAKRPTLVHVNSFTDLPTNIEKEKYKLELLPGREDFIEEQNNDKEGRMIVEFKNGERDILFSTRTARGIDFPGEQCNSIVFTKYPNPNVQEAFWKILSKTKPMHYWKFYKDKAKRELMQKVYRGLRFKGDHVYALSPDIRVINEFERLDRCRQ